MAETHPPPAPPYGLPPPYPPYPFPPLLPPPRSISITGSAPAHSFYRNGALAPQSFTSFVPVDRWQQPAAPIERLISNEINPPSLYPTYSPYSAPTFESRTNPGPRPPPRTERARHPASAIPSPTYTPKQGPDGSYQTPTLHPTEIIPSPRSASALGPPERSPRNRSGTLMPNVIDFYLYADKRYSDGRYEIRVRQQPEAARSCGFGERDRRVIDPPPIVELVVKDPKTGIPDQLELRYPFNVLHCTLWSADGKTDETALVAQDRIRTNRRLMGTLVSSPFFGKDDLDQEGSFFCFPDLSCRTPGKYKLNFVLMRLDPDKTQFGGHSSIITSVMSDVFTVFNAKDFPGMKASTPLTKALKRQGCAISVKKGNERANATEKNLTRTFEELSGDDEEADGGRPKRRRK
ncbi:MAG: hypothetical protein M1840_005300 [Geoglossum simile]|nr:MAG: hypothetical protein M1840_005300 [Geoglossum simile]